MIVYDEIAEMTTTKGLSSEQKKEVEGLINLLSLIIRLNIYMVNDDVEGGPPRHLQVH